MFKEIFSFELKYGLRKISTYIFAALLFGFFLLFGMLLSGVIDVPRSDSLVQVNSAYSVAQFLISSNANIMGLLNSIILITVMGTAIQKDYQYNIHPLIFTKPITKFGYFFGKYFASLLLALLIFTMPSLGFYVGLLLGYGNPGVGPFELNNFLQPFLIFVLPNVILQGVMILSITTFFRSTLPAYLFAIIVLVLQITTGNMLSNLDNKDFAAIIEPTGYLAFNTITEYWSAHEKNLNSIPFHGVILYNRLLWIGIAILVMIGSYGLFKFAQAPLSLNIFKKRERESQTILAEIKYEPITPQLDFSARVKQFFYLCGFEFKRIIKAPFFIILASLGLALIFILSQFMDSAYDTITYPVTYKIVDLIQEAYGLFIIIFVVFYTGTIVWREKELKTDELIGVTPVSNTSLFFSKFVGILMSIALMMVIGSVAGVLIQLSAGYFNIDLSQYAVMIMDGLISFGIIALMAMAVQTISSNKYLGFFFTLIPILILNIVFSLLQWDNPLIYFNSEGGSLPYSDMNGYGGKFFTFFIYKMYWFSFTLVFAIIGICLYFRGKEKPMKARWKLNRYGNLSVRIVPILLALISTAAFGSYIYYQNNIINTRISSKEMEKLMVAYEQNYKQYSHLPQPRIVDVNVNVDIFPSTKSMQANGTFILKNKTQTQIDTLVVNYNGGPKAKFTYTVLQPQGSYDVVMDDSVQGLRILKLATPLQPGDSLSFDMNMSYAQRGAFDATETSVIENGTFFNNHFFFTLGYNESQELGSNVSRKKHGLSEKERMPNIDDTTAYANTYISEDADWINFEATVSTESGQIAIAPGYLQKTWEKDGRVYYHYKMDSPILNFYSFLSAAYEVKKDVCNDVNIEIYYNKGHEYNVDRMIAGIKASLEYFTKNFGPYQHRQVRIIEFPRYASFAQSFPNTIPFSEAIGFITKVGDGPEDIDFPFYVTAHEVAHQWWAHQVIGAKVQGSVLLSESLSQYAALMVMEKTYGKESMKKFLKYELDNYLKGRTYENKKELPLMLVENQAYIHYNKGSVVLYALKEYLGEDVLNGMLKNFISKYKFQEPPYTTAKEFLRELKAVTPDSLQYLVTDLFEHITLYENYVIAWDYTQQDNGNFLVTAKVGMAKFYADEKGEEKTAQTLNDYVDIGIFVKNPTTGKNDELLMQRVKMTAPEQTFTFEVPQQPTELGIDPYYKLIDRTPKNNNLEYGQTPIKPNLTEGKKQSLIIEL